MAASTEQSPPPRPASDASHRFIGLPAGFAPRFIVTVDTEEEFDWLGPFTRDEHSTQSVGELQRFQSFCEDHGVSPIYLIDHPIVENDRAVEILRAAAQSGKAAVGIQLHPWVSPPFEEEVNERNSFACNLPPALEREKLVQLHDAIQERIGIKPEIYRAGRYGAGANARGVLRDLGVRIDSSVRARFDYSAIEGPDFSREPVRPYWIEPGKLAEIPLTTVYDGVFHTMGDWLFPLASQSRLVRAMLARTAFLERVSLTPEGIPADKAERAIDVALDQQLPILVFSFHSPSLAPGHTPYVRSEADVEALYGWWSAMFAHLKRRNVRPASLGDLLSAFFGG